MVTEPDIDIVLGGYEREPMEHWVDGNGKFLGEEWDPVQQKMISIEGEDRLAVKAGPDAVTVLDLWLVADDDPYWAEVEGVHAPMSDSSDEEEREKRTREKPTEDEILFEGKDSILDDSLLETISTAGGGPGGKKQQLYSEAGGPLDLSNTLESTTNFEDDDTATVITSGGGGGQKSNSGQKSNCGQKSNSGQTHKSTSGGGGKQVGTLSRADTGIDTADMSLSHATTGGAIIFKDQERTKMKGGALSIKDQEKQQGQAGSTTSAQKNKVLLSKSDAKALRHINRFPTAQCRSPRERVGVSRTGYKLVIGRHRRLSLVPKRANLKDYDEYGFDPDPEFQQALRSYQRFLNLEDLNILTWADFDDALAHIASLETHLYDLLRRACTKEYVKLLKKMESARRLGRDVTEDEMKAL
ncbi:unnamed protein product, partial [Amoebophrya sp. A25]|eukprot:GSA25T00006479001.1